MVVKRKKVFFVLILFFLIFWFFSIINEGAYAQWECTPGSVDTCTGWCCCSGTPAECTAANCIIGCIPCCTTICPNQAHPHEQRCCDDSGHWTYCMCGVCGSGCFTEEVEVTTKLLGEQTTKQIKELEPGEVVSSFNPETGEILEEKVTEVEKYVSEGYYELELESGEKVRVTGEHPFMAVKSNENFVFKLKNLISHTITHQLITSLQNKLNGVFD
jgi:Hint module.